MPYVTCPDCAATAYTAARFTTIDHCPLCDAQLPQLRAPRLPVAAPWLAAAGGPGPGAERALSGLPLESANAPR